MSGPAEAKRASAFEEHRMPAGGRRQGSKRKRALQSTINRATPSLPLDRLPSFQPPDSAGYKAVLLSHLPSE